MNYFGMFFTYMIPGILIGVTAVLSIAEARAARQKRARQVQRQADAAKRSLYVHDLSKEGFKTAA